MLQLLHKVILLVQIHTNKQYAQETYVELSQKGLIRDVGGFSGGIYECMHTKYADSIYGNVINT